MIAMTEMNKEYGTALFMLAKEMKAESKYAIDLECVMEVFSQSPEYTDFLASPSIPMNERLSALSEAFSEAIDENVLSFLKLLCERGRIRSLAGCVEEYKKLLDVENCISTAHITSAVELTEEEKEKLKDKLEIKCGHSVILECTVDQSLMGGLIIEVDGNIIDGSLKTRLHEVKDVISK